MKLLHVVASMEPAGGGVCQAVRTMIAGLAMAGVVSEVVSMDAPDATFLATDPFMTHALGPSRGPWAYSSMLAGWLTANLSHFGGVILHGLWLYPGYAVHRALHQLGKRKPSFFVMPHGMLDPYFQREAGRRLKALRNWVYWKAIEARIVNEAAGVLFTCEEERCLARESFHPYHPQRELVVGLGVAEPPPYTPTMREAFQRACPEAVEGKYLLFLSRIHEKKGTDLLVAAYQAEQTKTSSGAQGLVVAGPGLDTPYGKMVQLMAGNTPDTITLSSMLTGDAKWGAFYGCSAFILPSHQENFGIAVVESLACAKPVLITSNINIWREIEGGGGGLVADDTLTGCRALLRRWADLSPAAQQLMSTQARTTYQTHFAVPAATNQLLRALIEAGTNLPASAVSNLSYSF
jgi:glycosyltransferase involved in cell wall biosynthesis